VGRTKRKASNRERKVSSTAKRRVCESGSDGGGSGRTWSAREVVLETSTSTRQSKLAYEATSLSPTVVGGARSDEPFMSQAYSASRSSTAHSSTSSTLTVGSAKAVDSSSSQTRPEAERPGSTRGADGRFDVAASCSCLRTWAASTSACNEALSGQPERGEVAQERRASRASAPGRAKPRPQSGQCRARPGSWFAECRRRWSAKRAAASERRCRESREEARLARTLAREGAATAGLGAVVAVLGAGSEPAAAHRASVETARVQRTSGSRRATLSESRAISGRGYRAALLSANQAFGGCGPRPARESPGPSGLRQADFRGANALSRRQLPLLARLLAASRNTMINLTDVRAPRSPSP